MGASGWKEKGFETRTPTVRGRMRGFFVNAGGAGEAPGRQYYGEYCSVEASAESVGMANPAAAPIPKASRQAIRNFFNMTLSDRRDRI